MSPDLFDEGMGGSPPEDAKQRSSGNGGGARAIVWLKNQRDTPLAYRYQF
ncbi:hypothetical protein GCM10011534_25230 [Pseudooceanicola nanhaiensis]|uniref:Uncharacterized protein n=1 Tax=Pseudooceanicola nanhaiensis TaxID=375761 RepID=A0A917SX96_9RHOB|nr:hypothetical protein GCM10011534_25230 [Pseudooceanicola nanhaiensis]